MGLKIPETSACTHLNDEFLGTLGKCIVQNILGHSEVVNRGKDKQGCP